MMKIYLFSFSLLFLFLFVKADKLWEQKERADNRELVSLRVALKQQNLDLLEKNLLDVSDPTSVNYGKYWTYENIQNLVAPSAEVSSKVISFFLSYNILSFENFRDSLKITAPVDVVEKLFQVSLFKFQHTKKKSWEIIRATEESYSIPKEIQSYVDLISGLIEFPSDNIQERKEIKGPSQNQGVVIPAFIDALYNIPNPFSLNPHSDMSVIAFENVHSYDPADLSFYVSQNNITAFNVTHIGNFNPKDPEFESSLDIEVGGAVAQNTQMVFWTVSGWMYEFAVDLVASPNPPLVVSMSYGEPESLKIYVDRTNVEFQKAGLMGITLVASSGDAGAPGNNNVHCRNIKKYFSSHYPATSPWVLAVGATMLTANSTVSYNAPPFCSEPFSSCTNWSSEIVCQYPDADITSGGGFSDYIPMPSYQKEVVQNYLSSGVPLPPSNLYNSNNRAYPDVAAIGHNCLIAIFGDFQSSDGTSCSAPIWGGIISLLNSYRLNNNKSPLGFISPMIYQAYANDSSIFNDIIFGNNSCTEMCCGAYGYQATKGWDPVTGLGTLNFPKLLKYVASLP